MQENTNLLRKKLLDKVLACISGNTSHTELLSFATSLKNNKEITQDTPLFECIAILSFIAKQIEKGNADLVTRDLIGEGYVYVVNTLTPTV